MSCKSNNIYWLTYFYPDLHDVNNFVILNDTDQIISDNFSDDKRIPLSELKEFFQTNLCDIMISDKSGIIEYLLYDDAFPNMHIPMERRRIFIDNSK